MNFEEFNRLVEEAVSQFPSYPLYSGYPEGHDGFEIEEGVIIQSHVSGGAAGGDCWGNSARYFTNDQAPDDFFPIDYIINAVNPDLSYSRFRKIQGLIKEGTKGYSEYYGNHTNYTTYSLNIRELYDTLFPDEQNE